MTEPGNSADEAAQGASSEASQPNQQHNSHVQQPSSSKSAQAQRSTPAQAQRSSAASQPNQKHNSYAQQPSSSTSAQVQRSSSAASQPKQQHNTHAHRPAASTSAQAAGPRHIRLNYRPPPIYDERTPISNVFKYIEYQPLGTWPNFSSRDDPMRPELLRGHRATSRVPSKEEEEQAEGEAAEVSAAVLDDATYHADEEDSPGEDDHNADDGIERNDNDESEDDQERERSTHRVRRTSIDKSFEEDSEDEDEQNPATAVFRFELPFEPLSPLRRYQEPFCFRPRLIELDSPPLPPCDRLALLRQRLSSLPSPGRYPSPSGKLEGKPKASDLDHPKRETSELSCKSSCSRRRLDQSLCDISALRQRRMATLQHPQRSELEPKRLFGHDSCPSCGYTGLCCLEYQRNPASSSPAEGAYSPHEVHVNRALAHPTAHPMSLVLLALLLRILGSLSLIESTDGPVVILALLALLDPFL